MQSRALAKPKPSKKTCTHPSFRRYGNAHGRFTECLRCEAKFRWMQDQEGWVEYSPKSSSSSALPMPSSANILTPKDLAPKTKGTSSKSKPKAASTPQRTYRTSSMGTRSPSVHRMDSGDGYRGTGYSREEFEEIMSSMGSEAFPPSSDGGRDGYPDEEWDW